MITYKDIFDQFTDPNRVVNSVWDVFHTKNPNMNKGQFITKWQQYPEEVWPYYQQVFPKGRIPMDQFKSPYTDYSSHGFTDWKPKPTTINTDMGISPKGLLTSLVGGSGNTNQNISPSEKASLDRFFSAHPDINKDELMKTNFGPVELYSTGGQGSTNWQPSPDTKPIDPVFVPNTGGYGSTHWQPSPSTKPVDPVFVPDDNFDIPTNKFPWSYTGMGPNFQGFLSELMPMIKSTYMDFPEKQQEYYAQARGDITQGYDEAANSLSNAFNTALQPALQRTLNSLASRNMINSSVASDTMTGTASRIGEGIANKLASLNLAKQGALADLAKTQGQTMYQLPQLLTNLIGQGRFSLTTDELAPYKVMADMLTAG